MRRWRSLAFAAVLAALFASACARGRPNTFAGFVDAPVAAVSSQLAGQIAAVEFREGDRVHRGQLLARLDPRERVAALAQAEANLERARAALREAEQNARAVAPTVQGAIADVARQRAELDDARAEHARITALAQSGAATPSQLDAARARLEQARAAVASMGAAGTATRGRVDAALASVRTSRASVAVNEAAVNLARVQLAQSEIRSPFEGLLAEQNLQPGEWAAPGTPVVTVEDLTRQWVRIDVEETALRGLRLGSPAVVRVVARPGRTYRARVIEIGAEGEFALNRDVKRGRPDVRTFRVRVGLEQIAEELRPGMTAEVEFVPDRAAPDARSTARTGGPP